MKEEWSGRQAGAFELLAGLTARLASTARLDEIVATVLGEIVHLGFGAVWMAVLDEPTGHLLTLKEVIDGVDTTHEMPRIFMLDMRQPIGHGFRERRMINIVDPDSLFIIERDDDVVPPGRLALPRVIYEHLRGHPFACGPLLDSRGQPVGAIGVSSYRGRQPIPDDLFTHGLLRAFMDHLGIAMERALHVAKLERLNADLLQAQAAIEATARIRAVGELAAAVAHDLNNLSGIALLAVSAGLQSPTAAHDVLPRIERANRAIGDLVARLQRVARPASPDGEARDVAYLPQILDDILAMIGPMLRERSIALERIGESTPAVRADPTLVHQVVLNLLLNAQDALAEVDRESRLIRIATTHDRDTVRLTISDTGPGIAPEILPRLFQPFVTTKRGTHVGLGLAAAHASLTHFGGKLAGRNLTGGGAAFEVCLAVAPPELARQPAARVAAPPNVQRRGSILAVDDDADILDVVRVYLESIGYDVRATTNVDDAMEFASARFFDLILCDVGMPKRSGLEVCDALREAGYRGKLVLMTGWDSHLLDADRRARRCDMIIKKPFVGPDLIHVIDTLLVA